MKQVLAIARKEMLLEFKERHTFGGIVLFAVAAVFICYLGFHAIPNPNTWNALFWIMVLFSSFNSMSRSFQKEERGVLLYLYSLAPPGAIIIGKLIYNSCLTLVLTVITLLVYLTFMGRAALAEADIAQFISAALLGAIGLAGALTLISGIAAKTGNVFGMMAVLGFPVIIPMLVTVLRVSKNALDGIALTVNTQYFMVLLGLNLLVWVLSFLLFPYLWRD